MSVEPLIEWIRAREALRKLKETGVAPPWTPDLIFRQYRFCNVRRRDDRVSRWLLKYILTEDNLNKVGLKSFLEFTAFCRWNNWPPVIARIIQEDLFPHQVLDWRAIGTVVDKHRAECGKAWTGAYMINSKGLIKPQTKAQYITESVISKGIGGAVSRLEKALNTGFRREVWLVLRTLPNFGGSGFMAGQVVDDWGWTSLLANAKDTFTWAPQGPGSLRGFNRLIGIPLNKTHSEEEWCGQLQAWRKEIILALGKEYLNLDLHSMQSCLCELDKYLRVKNGEGRPRSKYRPETAY